MSFFINRNNLNDNTKTMNKIKKLFILTLIVGFTINASGQSDEVTTNSAKARLVAGLTLENETDLQFGDLLLVDVSTTGAAITINASNEVESSADGNVKVISISGATTPSRGKLTVTGEPGLNFTITGSAGNLVTGTNTTITDATKSMQLTDFEFTVDSDLTVVTANSDTTDSVKVKLAAATYTAEFYATATMTVKQSQVSGVYEGTYTVKVEYE
jgi:hypothetical protein